MTRIRRTSSRLRLIAAVMFVCHYHGMRLDETAELIEAAWHESYRGYAFGSALHRSGVGDDERGGHDRERSSGSRTFSMGVSSDVCGGFSLSCIELLGAGVSYKPPRCDACNKRIRRNHHELLLSDFQTGQIVGHYHARPECQAAAAKYI